MKSTMFKKRQEKRWISSCMHELDLAFQGISTTVTIFLFSAVTSSDCLFRCLSCVSSSGLREWDVTQDLCGILNLSLLLPYSPSRTPEVPQHDITVTLLREGVPFYWKLPYCDERDQSSNSWPFFPEFFTYLHVRQCCTVFLRGILKHSVWSMYLTLGTDISFLKLNALFINNWIHLASFSYLGGCS